MAVSLVGQGLLISAAVLVPLVYPETLQRGAFWIPVTDPPRAYRPPAPARVEPARTMAAHRVFHPRSLFQPSSVPDGVAMVPDEPAAVTGGPIAPCIACVPGGIGDPGPLPPGIEQATRPAPPPAPPPVQPAPMKPAARPAPVTRGGEVQAALLIHGPQPIYPPLAKQARISGVVRLAALIGTDGHMVDLRATSGHPLLVKAAIDGVKQWVYRPTLLNNVPVEVVTEITVTFTLN
jgi:protein TonB